MKPLGKKDVTMRVMLNGVISREYVDHRTVYQKSDGSLYINDVGGKHPVTQTGSVILAVFDVRSLAVRTLTLPIIRGGNHAADQLAESAL